MTDDAAGVGLDTGMDEGGLGLGAQRLRLSDAEWIATVRLDGAPAGSLKEALATSIVQEEDGGSSLSERLASIQHLTETVQPLRSFHVAPATRLGWEEAVPPAHALGEDAGTVCAPTSELSGLMPAPCLNVAWEQAWEQCQTQAEAPWPADQADEPAHADAETGVLELPWSPSLAELLPGPDEARAGAEEAVAQAEAPAAASYEIMRVQSVEPIVSALAENARLAAEATAASHALLNLKKMLADRIVIESQAAPSEGPPASAPDPAAAQPTPVAMPEPASPPPVQVAPAVELPADPEPVKEAAAIPARRLPPPLPVMPPSVVPAPPQAAAQGGGDVVAKVRREARAQRREGPAIAEVPRAAQREAETSEPKPHLPRALAKRPRRKPAPAPKRRPRGDGTRISFDIGGFLAGFALSGAIGVVLYFVMTAT